ncbi:MAG: hypothetical protein KBF88_09430 [Polyangiaceae bacterium]|nr:hypothetical protein [Polyangiaceae bacterium]
MKIGRLGGLVWAACVAASSLGCGSSAREGFYGHWTGFAIEATEPNLAAEAFAKKLELRITSQEIQIRYPTGGKIEERTSHYSVVAEEGERMQIRVGTQELVLAREGAQLLFPIRDGYTIRLSKKK